MALFGKLFEKKECAICGGEIGLLGNRKLEDGNCCKNCAAKLSPWFSDRRQSTVEEIKEQLAYREANQEKVAAFRVTRTLGEGMKVLLDEDDGRFMVTSARIQYKDAEGKRQSFSPRRYAFSYDFYIVINVNNPYFNEIRFKLNGSSVDNETLLDGPDAQPCVRGGGLRTGGAGPIRPGMPGGSRPGARPFMGGSRTSNADEVRSSMEYRQYEEMGREIRDALLRVREQVRNEAVVAAAPKTALTCPFCGATTTPDASGCCEFCGGAVNG